MDFTPIRVIKGKMRDFQTNGVSTTVSGWKKIKLDYIYNILKINFRCIKDV